MGAPALLAIASLMAIVPAAATAGKGAKPSGLCFQEAGRRYNLSPALLEAIGRRESSLRPGAINTNRDGTRDLGVMQINTTHLPTLARWGITEQALLQDPCLNIHVGAWVLRQHIAVFGPTWRAIGAYNAGNGSGRDSLRVRYAAGVSAALEGVPRSPRAAQGTAVAQADQAAQIVSPVQQPPVPPSPPSRLRVFE